MGPANFTLPLTEQTTWLSLRKQPEQVTNGKTKTVTISNLKNIKWLSKLKLSKPKYSMIMTSSSNRQQIAACFNWKQVHFSIPTTHPGPNPSVPALVDASPAPGHQFFYNQTLWHNPGPLVMTRAAQPGTPQVRYATQK